MALPSRHLTTLAVGLLLLAACASSGDAPPPRPDPEARTLEGRSFTEAGRRDIFVRQGLRFAARSGVEIRTQLGSPAEILARGVPNMHDPAVTDSIFTWRYDALDLDIYRTADGRRLLSQALVRDNRHLRFPEAGVGVAEAEIRRLFGAPDMEAEGELEFRCGSCEGPGESVVFRLQAGRVAELRFLFPLD